MKQDFKQNYADDRALAASSADDRIKIIQENKKAAEASTNSLAVIEK